jgi:hypothetical protein
VLIAEFDQAQELLDSALTINAHLPDPDWEIAICANKQIANILTIKGQIKAAEAILNRVKTLEETIYDS